MRIIFTFFLLSLLVGLSFAEENTGWNIIRGLCDLYSLMNTAGIFIFGILILMSAGIYAGGQFFGAEYRSKSVVYATGIAVGAVIGILIYFTLPLFIEMISGENVKEACGWVETEGYLMIGGREVGSLTLTDFLTTPHAYGVEIDGIALYNALHSPAFENCFGSQATFDSVTMNDVNAQCKSDKPECVEICNTILATVSIYADWTGGEDNETLISGPPECASGLIYCRCFDECFPDDNYFDERCSGSCSGDYTWDEIRCACVDEDGCEEDEFHSDCKAAKGENPCVDEDKCTKKGLEWDEGICGCIDAGQLECEEDGKIWSECDGGICIECTDEHPIWDESICDCVDEYGCKMSGGLYSMGQKHTPEGCWDLPFCGNNAYHISGDPDHCQCDSGYYDPISGTTLVSSTTDYHYITVFGVACVECPTSGDIPDVCQEAPIPCPSGTHDIQISGIDGCVCDTGDTICFGSPSAPIGTYAVACDKGMDIKCMSGKPANANEIRWQNCIIYRAATSQGCAVVATTDPMPCTTVDNCNAWTVCVMVGGEASECADWVCEQILGPGASWSYNLEECYILQ
ncbi:YIP1 family protein [Candidatus Micrarchaeota archaeon]|nr:YIP1 family protein [Candidatus Micrarchaeota archaeon]